MNVALVVTVLLAFLLDYLLGEAKRFHPLVGFGNWAIWLEKAFNDKNKISQVNKSLGILAWLFAVVPITVLFFFMQEWLVNTLGDGHWLVIIFAAFILYLAMGWKSLLEHAMNIATPLKNNDLIKARLAVSMIVSRDTQNLNENGIATAATESVLENGADAIFSALFWFLLLGVPGVVMYRLSNTLDAMWGYKNERFLHFGWCAARVDDVLNFIPARLTALSYALVGSTRVAIHCWRQQGLNWKSPNAGPVMAAGAGALNVSLGGAAQYHSQMQHRPNLGPHDVKALQANGESIVKACKLVNKAILLWVVALVFILMIINVLEAMVL